MEESETKPNIVRTTVRMDGDLHGFLTDFVYELGRGLPPRQRPTIDSVIQSAVRMYLEAGKTRPGLTDKDEAILASVVDILRQKDSTRESIEFAVQQFEKRRKRKAEVDARLKRA